ncbi:3-oxoacyl-ACP synthase III family protein [Krasilnikovia sp. M28-CT-15]|uniref:3-oxoacyl-ACP synthase III family protein n=1 Tax=Krasilnikovia sp. M28-CT-15 TaxID=3373540 RepID=UPI00399CF99D
MASFGSALGEAAAVADVVDEYCEDVERVKGYGYRQVLRCPPGVGLTDLAVDAGGEALVSAGVDASHVDLVVLAVTDIAEYLYWDAAASVAHRLGADRAESMLLSQACTSGVVAFDAVAGRFATHPEYHTALIVTANRTCEPYWNRMATQPMVFSDAAAAAVARRGHGRLRWLATEVHTAGRYAPLYRMAVGGAAEPFAPGHTADDLVAADAWEVMDFFDYDAERFEAFIAELDERTCRVVAAACKRVGMEVTDLARLVLLADNQDAMSTLCARLGVDPARTNMDLAAQYGHLGAADQIFGLARIAQNLTPGDRVALVSRGRGMHWACTIMEV